eukprot:CAMPEP_0202867702 /NCGR_PEP_ID=MMETSP1391-20130828/9579_1 /ASSEMBLY_ACC=CAM_ASM_000867 /TAXON_ID=1034604 /ORGANISM="Chlamydomonas leiostraca, Strain SAG 11-49" /LENGTH=220 /DNA_ID=CAMNT_0049547765 /DNA_START=15 /DNA_END=677 /DNA_ORIENTATION=+
MPLSLASPSQASTAACRRGAPCRLHAIRHASIMAMSAPRRTWLQQRKLDVTASASQQSQAAPASVPVSTVWSQKVIELPPYSRGCHVITRKIYEAMPEIAEFEVGMANVFIQHTSASLTINENASPDVPLDLNDALDALAPESRRYRHSDEGPDDMPAHVKSSLMGASLQLPVAQGRFALGTWQGVYLNEHRNYGGPRRVVITVQGQKRADGRKYSQFIH